MNEATAGIEPLPKHQLVAIPNLIILGMTGSGKSWLAREIADIHGHVALDMSDMIAAVGKLDNPIGEKVRHWRNSPNGFAAGKLVDNDCIEAALALRLMNVTPQQKVILMGVPRHIDQVASLTKVLNLKKIRPNSFRAVTLRTRPETVIERMGNPDRANRPDQSMEVVEKKIKIFTKQNQLIINLLARRHGIYHHTVNANLDKEAVLEEALKKISSTVDH